MRTKGHSLFLLFVLSTYALSRSSPPPATTTCTTELVSSINDTVLPFNASSLRCVSGLDFLGYSMLYEQSAEDTWSIVVVASSDVDGYVGVGFSPTGRMVGSSAVVGWFWPNGTAAAKQYDLRGQRPSECIPNAGALRLVEGSTQLVLHSSRVFLAFRLNTSRPRERVIFSLGPEGFRPSSNLLLQEHRAAQSTIIDYITGQSTSVKFSEKLKTIHGIIAMAGWGVLVPVGMMVARYGKRWDPLWFYSHLSIQSLGFALGVAAVVTGFKYEHRSLKRVGTHKAIGIAILVLGVLQVMAFVVRPDKKAKVRRYWNWYHHNVGRIALGLAVGNIYYGFHLGRAVRPWRIAFAVYLGVLLLLSFVFELLLCRANRARNQSK